MPRFANIKGSMNPFDNNKPVLSSSDRLKNKRDKTIYQAEKLRFRNKRCGDKNVKYYNNGSIRNMKSYGLQKSLARGNVLCEDCDDKGLLCGGVASKSALGSIQMGNNVVSEYWGGGDFIFSDNFFTQSITFPVIQSDISGSWGGTTDKADLSGQKLPGSDPSANMFWGYIDNLIKIPRNLNGTGIVIDPCNNLFPDGHCGPYKHLKSHIPYMNHSNLKTYLVITTAVTLDILAIPKPPLICSDPSLNDMIGQQISAIENGAEPVVILNGVIDSVCCKRTETFSVNPISGTTPGWSLFDIYVELHYVADYVALNKMVTMVRPYKPTELTIASPFFVFTLPNIIGSIIFPWYIESFRIFQGTKELNQTKHNTTKQSYMSCLENKTKKIKFT